MKNIKKTTNQFILEVKELHDNKYDYSLVEYINSKTKVKIICKEHGEFNQTPDSHLNKKSDCPKCVNNVKLTTEEFIIKSKRIHGDKYDYSLVDYLTGKIKVTIICPTHGYFKQAPTKHLCGDGCPKCSGHFMDTDYFIEKSKRIHGDKYDYSLSNYTNQTRKIKIICHTHGVFKQNPNNHMNGNGCPMCKESKGEKMIGNWLVGNNVKFSPQYRFDDCRNILPLPFDFYLPDYNVCIEFNGRQHYIPIDMWGGKVGLEETQKRDKIKMEYCNNNNIPLIIIKYNENLYNKLDKLNTLINIKP
jgi:hypothetical protein